MAKIAPGDMRPTPAPGKIVKQQFNPADYRANYIFTSPFANKKGRKHSLHGKRLAYGVHDPWGGRGMTKSSTTGRS